MSRSVNLEIGPAKGFGVLAGRVSRKLDEKRRITISANWRHVMDDSPEGPKYVFAAPNVTSGGEPIIDLIPEPVIQQRFADLQDIDEDDPLREHMNNLFSNMAHVALDCQGRVRVPDFLLDYAGLKEYVMMTGSGDCIKLMAVAEQTPEEGKVDFEAFRKSRMTLAELRKKT